MQFNLEIKLHRLVYLRNMKSLYFEKYGSSDVLSVRDIPKPTLEPGRVMIRVHAVSINPLDWRLMKAEPFLARFAFGLLKPKLNGLGADFSGVVESVASDVSDFSIGDAVFGIMTPEIVGALSEYISIPATGLVKKPDNLTHVAASTLGVAALTAYEGIHDYRRPTVGDTVLINGASGGIGTFAVQMAKALGAHVTAVCSGKNHEMVKRLGADVLIDYKTADFLQTTERFDLVYDTIGNHPPKHIKHLLKEDGRLVLASAADGFGFLKAMRAAKKDPAIDMIVELKKDPPRLKAVLQLVEDGITPVIDRTYPLNEAASAIDYVATKRARGKVVVTLGKT